MSWSSTQGLACSEDRSRHDLGHRVLLSCSTLPLPPKASNPAPTGSGPSLSPDQNPGSVPRRPPLLHSPLRHPGCFLCVFVRGHQSHLYSGNLWEGLVGRSDPGVIWSPSFNSFLPSSDFLPRQLPFLLGPILLACRLPPPLTFDFYEALYYEHIPKSCLSHFTNPEQITQLRRASVSPSVSRGQLPGAA